MGNFHATTIFAVHHNGECAMAGDGQVTMGNAVVMKHTARKVRKLFQGKVLAGLQVRLLMHLLFLKCLKGN